jgi:valyl-tRNA synthetase
VNQSLTDYRYDEAASAIYKFFWNEFCDWYLEIIKPRLLGDEKDARPAVAFLGDVFEASLRLLSPFMPFITEEIWHAMYEGRTPQKSIALAKFPEGGEKWLNDQAEEEMATLQSLISEIRNLRAELQVEPKAMTPVRIHTNAAIQALVSENRFMLERLPNVNVSDITFVSESLTHEPGVRTTPKFEIVVMYKKQIDVAAERARLTKELARHEGQLANTQKQLGNEQFLAKAPPQVVDGLKKQAAELQILIDKARKALDALK